MRAFNPVRKNYKKVLNRLWFDRRGPSLPVLDPKADFQGIPLRQQAIFQKP